MLDDLRCRLWDHDSRCVDEAVGMDAVRKSASVLWMGMGNRIKLVSEV